MEPLSILLHGQAQLLDWGESRSTGPWIKLRLEGPEQLTPFRGLDTASQTKAGHIFNLTITQGDILPAEDPVETTYRTQAAVLWKSGFLRALPVWIALGVREANEQDARVGRIKSAHKRAWDALKESLGYDSMADVPPAEVRAWAAARDLVRFLPEGYV